MRSFSNLPEPLHDGLAGQLGGNCAQGGGIDLPLDELADYGARLEAWAFST